MSGRTQGLALFGTVILLAACSPQVDESGVVGSSSPAAMTETVTATVTMESEESVPPTPTASSEDLRAVIDQALLDTDLELTPEMCVGWRRDQEGLLAKMSASVMERLEPLRPTDPDQIEEVAEDAIRNHIDVTCAAIGPPDGADAARPTPTEPAQPAAPDSMTEGWDVVNGDYYATVTSCPTDDWGDPVAVVKVLNNGSRDSDVVGVVEVIDTATNERDSEMYFYAARVKPGQTVSVEAMGFGGVPDTYMCFALDVEPTG